MMIKKAGEKANVEYMDKAQKHNSDGYGVAWHENDMVKTYKTFNYEVFKKVVEALEDFTLVIHLRYTTKGGTTFSNIHPFDTPSGVMFHNGTMFDIKPKAGMSDSAALADTLCMCDYETISDIEPLIRPYIDDKINRLVFFEDSGEVVIMNKDLGIEEDGVWYSNDYHLKDEGWCRTGSCKPKFKYAQGKDLKDLKGRNPEGTYYVNENEIKPKETKTTMELVKPRVKTHKVFVYGTLKRGGSNSRLIKDAVFLGKATTSDKWTMVGKGAAFPYVMEKREDKGNNVVGEVFAVDSKELAALDRLEGIPHHYKRNTIEVDYSDDGTTEEVIMYTKAHFNTDYVEKQEIITEWSA